MSIFSSKLRNGFKFKEKLIQKYKLTIDSKMNLGGFLSENKIEIRWQLAVKDINEDYSLLELITLDNTMVKSDNSGFFEMHRLVSQMNKSLSEIKFKIDKKGKLLEIVNLKNIQERWKTVKEELFEYNKNNASLQELFSLQDETFENNDGVEKMIIALEFFTVYINNFYGWNYPYVLNLNVPNIFRSADIPFILEYERKESTSSFYKVSVVGEVERMSTSFIEKAYGKFPFVEAKDTSPIFTYKGNYIINDETGFIKSGELLYAEEINSKLGGELKYTLQSYE